MLKRFRANNFKSLVNIDFRPSGLNLLIGPNNAGKTNLCSALHFLGLSSQKSLDSAVFDAVGETWNLTNAYPSKPEIELEVDVSLPHGSESLDYSYRLTLQAKIEGNGGRQQLGVVEETLSVTGGPFKNMLLIEHRGGVVRMLHEEGFVQRRPDAPYYVETRSPEGATMLSRLYELKDNPRASLFKRYLHSWFYFCLYPDALRMPDVLRDYPVLRSDGANLSRAMHSLHNEKPRLEKQIIDALKPIEPKLDLFSYSSPDPEHVYLFLEDAEGHRFGSRSISDGSLRLMAIAFLLVAIPQLASEVGIRPLVIIEEPENGLYVGHLKPLIERVDSSGQCGQFIFTSHNPYFIDLFDAHLDGLHLMRPGRPSSVIVRPDAEKVRKLIQEMPLGELHYRELLE